MDLNAGSGELLNHGIAPGRIAHSEPVNKEKTTQTPSSHLVAPCANARVRGTCPGNPAGPSSCQFRKVDHHHVDADE